MIQRGERREIPASAGEKKQRRILGVDYGRKRIGLALSDELGMTAQPLATLVRANRQNDLRRLREICRKHGVGRVVVGQPLHLSGEAGPMAEEAARFAERLRKGLGIEVDLQDERLTSWEAETQAPVRRKRAPLDDVAAAILLRDYLEKTREASPSAAAEKD
ncbi:MAG TPA: Holliday junction resolvase RuvX [Candidatus Acidoferrales bacterium]|nr:Holliday junction resolvase RuvX [Candidatus Acidoferrales bacterium]